MPESKTGRSLIALVVFVALAYGASAVGGAATAAGRDGWYDALIKPALTPPGSVVGTVWTILFGLMAVAAWLVWRSEASRLRNAALILWGFQLVLNVLWSVLFFYAHQLGLAFAELLMLWLVILVTTLLFYRASTVAAALMVPYLAWVAFAGYLNVALWWLNA